MLSSISNYLFGAVKAEEQLDTNDEERTDDQRTSSEFRISNESDDWILVEHHEGTLHKQSEQQCGTEVDLPGDSLTGNHVCLESINNPQLCSHFLEQQVVRHDGLPGTVESRDTSDTDVSSTTHPSMDGSWLVTPPACFTAGIGQMETSSMENLLIEHPSMSVYQHHGRHSSTGLDSNCSDSSNDEEELDLADEAVTESVELPHRPRAISAHVGLTQIKTVQSMQRAHQRHVYKDLSKKNLRRGNLTCYAQGRHSSRKQLVHQPRARMAFYTKRH